MFVEFDGFSGADSWSLLQWLTNASGDSHVEMTLLNPDARDYFYKEFGVFGALQLNVNNTGRDYFDSLSTCPASSPD